MEFAMSFCLTWWFFARPGTSTNPKG